MSLHITSLNSGSNGNCYYLGNEEEAVLVDAGITCKETELRMERLGLSMNKVKAIFISHEHADHIKGVHVIARKYKLPVYSTPPTLQYCRLDTRHYPVIHFKANEPVSIGNLHITAFPKIHDASEPFSFVVACNDIKVGVFTDIGQPCSQLIYYFRQCHAAFLESNYDEDMLVNGKYPYYLKRRISGGSGHLSNSQALEVFTTHRPANMSHLILSHLSKENNNPDLVYNLFAKHASGTNIVVASRYKETQVFTINASAQTIQKKPTFKSNLPVQTAMF